MKAIVYETYGSPDVLQLQEIDKPVVNDDDVLVRVRAVGTNPYDKHFMRGTPYMVRLVSGLFKPKANGMCIDLAGQVEAIGKNVTRFRPGDAVFGELPMMRSALAEYVCVSEDWVELKPANLTFEQAAAVPMAGFTALQGLRDIGQIQSGHKVLINGASGGVGTFAVQLAKSFGAEVTGVCSARNVDMVRLIGADQVIDYTQEDFTQGGQRYDLLFDTVVNRSLSECRRVLSPTGVYVVVGDPGGDWIRPLTWPFKVRLASLVGGRRMVSCLAKPNKRDLLFLKELLEAGKVTPVIDKIYPLSEAPEAIRYLEEGHAQGKVLITV